MKTLLCILSLITLPMFAADSTYTGRVGDRLILTANVTKPVTNPPETVYRIQWMKDNRAISGQLFSTLAVTLASAADFGVYSFKVTAEYGGTLSEPLGSDKGYIRIKVDPAQAAEVGIAPAPTTTPVQPTP